MHALYTFTFLVLCACWVEGKWYYRSSSPYTWSKTSLDTSFERKCYKWENNQVMWQSRDIKTLGFSVCDGWICCYGNSTIHRILLLPLSWQQNSCYITIHVGVSHQQKATWTDKSLTLYGVYRPAPPPPPHTHTEHWSACRDCCCSYIGAGVNVTTSSCKATARDSCWVPQTSGQ